MYHIPTIKNAFQKLQVLQLESEVASDPFPTVQIAICTVENGSLADFRAELVAFHNVCVGMQALWKMWKSVSWRDLHRWRLQYSPLYFLVSEMS